MCEACFHEFRMMGPEELQRSITSTRQALDAARKAQHPSRWKCARILEAKENLLPLKQKWLFWDDESLRQACKRLAALYDDLYPREVRW